ncbi:MAG: hypothetical protein Q4B70_10155 [Lachnospiraceae bacterium]|nr:hypothetical protein [Lachnospiraceae bacterium]
MYKLYSVNDTVFGKGFKIASIKAFNKKAAAEIEAYLKKRPHEIYGSGPQASWGSKNQRRPADLDLGITNPKQAATELAKILKRNGYLVRVRYLPEYSSAKVETLRRGVWDTIIDLQPLKKHQTERMTNTNARPVPPKKDERTGLYIQSPSDQLRRKHNAILEKDMPEHRKVKDSYDYVAIVNDLQESENLKKDVKLLTGMPSFGEIMKTPWKSSAWVLAEKLEREKGLDKKALDNAALPPLSNADKRKWVKFVTNHPDIDINKIDIGDDGEIYVNGRRYHSEKMRGRRK